MHKELEYLRLEQDGKVLVVWLNNPPVNALNSVLMQELKMVLVQAAGDESIGSLIITGEGKFFAAGADIKELKELLDKDSNTKRDFILKNEAILKEIETFPKPVIAAINGHALGGGLELVLACHFRFASSRAQLGLPEINLGIFPGWGGTWRLPKLIGRSKALRMILTGETISAIDAAPLGMINEVWHHDELLARTKDFAKILAGKSQDALICALLTINEEMGQEEVADIFAELLGEESAKKGINDFLNRGKRN
jgi:enoyl-CoA hydratase